MYRRLSTSLSLLLIASAQVLAAPQVPEPGELPPVPSFEEATRDQPPTALDRTPPDPIEAPSLDSALSRAANAQGAGAPPFADRLNEGPQEVGVMVDVTGPPAANLNIEAKLTLTVRNQGRNEAFDVVVTDALPEHLKFVSASPPPDQSDGGVLVWRLGTLPMGVEKVIELKVTPVRDGPIDHVPRVDFSTGAKARMTIHNPTLRVEVTPSKPQLLKGEVVDFNITIINTGTGPATNVAVQTEISKGLRYDGEKLIWSQEIGDLGPQETKGPYPFTVDAIALGDQTCTVTALSDDVVPKGADGSIALAKVVVIAPDLVVDVSGPTEWLKGSRAIYRITVTNKGTAAAQKVAVGAFPPSSGVPEPPPETEIMEDRERGLNKIYWRLSRLDPGQSKEFQLPIRLDEIQNFTLNVAASSQSVGPAGSVDTVRHSITTKVDGLADIEILEIDRADQVIGVGDKTDLTIRLQNEGSKEAKDVKVYLLLNECLQVDGTDGTEGQALQDPNPPGYVIFPVIDRIPIGGEKKLYVRVLGQKAGRGDFRVHVFWDGLSEKEAKDKKTFVVVREGASPSP